jgi:hypothetical protein
MAVPQRLATVENQVIEKALRRLCAKALRRHWILENGRDLLGLDCVRAYLVKNAKEEDYADALREYLEDAIQRVESPERRVVLEVVLGLGKDRWKTRSWRHKSVDARQKEAGRRFRLDEEETVTAGTIRKVHQPQAIRDLAEVICADEHKAREARKDGAGS